MAAVSNQSALIVPPPPAGVTNELRPIRPPVEIPNDWAWVWWTLLAVALLIAGFWLWKRMRKKRAIVARPPPLLPHVLAKHRLQAALTSIHDPREFCIRVSDAVRSYLEGRFQFHAPDRTTEEFMQELQGTHLLTLDQRLNLAQFLQSCDLVKFAQHEPTESALRDLFDSALRLVEETQFERIRAEGASELVNA